MDNSRKYRLTLVWLFVAVAIVVFSAVLIGVNLHQKAQQTDNIISIAYEQVRDAEAVMILFEAESDAKREISKETVPTSLSKRLLEQHKKLFEREEVYSAGGENSEKVQILLSDIYGDFTRLKNKIGPQKNKAEQSTISSAEIVLSMENYYEGIQKVLQQYRSDASALSKGRRDLMLYTGAFVLFVLVFVYMFSILPLFKAIDAQKQEYGQLNRDLLNNQGLKSEVLANLSHELRTPIDGIVGMAELLERTDLNKDQKDNTAIIKQAALSSVSLLDSLLAYAKSEKVDATLTQKSFSLSDLMQEVVSLMKPLAVRKGLRLTMSQGEEIPNQLLGDEGKIKQVLLNLLNNAIKYSDAGEVQVTTELVNATNGLIQLKFDVLDQGKGLADQEVSELFKSFSQTGGEKGAVSSLGLAISANLVKAMNGNIYAENRKSGGSRFSFTIVVNAYEGESLGSPTFKGVHAIVIDNNDFSLKMLVRQLSHWNIKVTPISNPALLDTLESKLGEYDLCIVNLALKSQKLVQLTKHISTAAVQNQTMILLGVGDQNKGDWPKNMALDAKFSNPIEADKLLKLLSEKFKDRCEFVGTTPKNRFTKLKILVAESDDMQRAVVSKNLQLLGYTPEIAANQHDLIAKIHKRKYDVILLDQTINSNGNGGMVKQIKSIHPEHSPYILGLLDTAGGVDQAELLKQGMHGGLENAEDMNLLSNKINQLHFN